MINVDYIISFKITGRNSGKEKASAEKIKYLKKLSCLNAYTLDTVSSSERFKSIKMIVLDFYYLFHVIFIRKNKPGLIFARSNFHFGPFIVSKLYHIPLINEVHTDILDEGKILFRDSVLKRNFGFLWHHYCLFFLKRSDGLIFNNTLLEKYYKEHFLNKTTPTITVHNGCDPEFFYPFDKYQARSHLGLRKDICYLLFIGSISRWHGVEYILETFRHLNRLNGNKEIRLLIVGGYNVHYLQSLKEKYSDDNIVFKGEALKDEAFYYINAADICLLPVNNIRISPGSPLKLFDYAACGKPIIAQQCTMGYSDIIEKYNLGITCDFTDYKSAAPMIINFLDSYNEAEFKYNNRKKAEEYLSWEKVLGKWIRFGLSLRNSEGGL